MNIQKNKIFFILTFFLVSFFFLIFLIFFEYYQKKINFLSRKEAHALETYRKKNVDRALIASAKKLGYKSINYPFLYEENYISIKKKLNQDLDIIPVNSYPYKKNFYCNEGYGLIKYNSDRFGFRNNDKIWNTHKNNDKILLVGDFLHMVHA